MIRTSIARFGLIVGLTFSSFLAYTQKGSKASIIHSNTVVRPGKVTTVDGLELKGTVSFNQNESIVTVTTSDESKSFNARRLLSFELNEPGRKGSRLFYSLVFPDPHTGITDPDFFEVLAEFDAFAVLSRQGRLQSRTSTEVNRNTSTANTTVTLSRSEIIYFMDNKGDFFPYVGISQTESITSLYRLKNNGGGFIDKEVFKKFTGEYYPLLKSFAKKNGFRFTVKDDLRTILQEYKKLSSS
jgi:hypothetical protein